MGQDVNKKKKLARLTVETTLTRMGDKRLTVVKM